jgi:long-chain acyl-CoA synthetase
MCSVPRLYEKMYARVLEKVAGDPPARQKIFRWAIGVGRRLFHHRSERSAPGLLDRAQGLLADKLVFGKIRARTGGRLKLFVSGGAPLSREINEFFGAVGLQILEGYGLTETSPVITCNRPDRFKPGTVGLPLPGVEVSIAADGEILTRGPHVMKGYYNKPQATAEALDAAGWFHTGDVGIIDADGFLTITDRKKDLIGDRRNFPCALVVPNFETLEKWAREKGVGFASRDELVQRPEVVALYDQTVRDLTPHLANFERIKKVALLTREFTLESGELTPTLKVKRRVIEQKYKDVIDRIYDAA